MPRAAAEELLEVIAEMSVGAAITTSQADALKVKVSQAIAKLDAEKANTAANHVGTFINQVRGLELAGQLGKPAADKLTFVAQGILDQLGE